MTDEHQAGERNGGQVTDFIADFFPDRAGSAVGLSGGSSGGYAVVGASTNREKYGNKVVRAYQQAGMTPVPVNPRAETIEGEKAYASLTDIPGLELLRGVSIITPPKITAQVIDEAIGLGIQRLWLQPGAEHAEAIARAEAAGLSVIAHGPCVLVVLGYREHV